MIEMKRKVIKLGGLVIILLLEKHSLQGNLQGLINDKMYKLIKIQDWKYLQNILDSKDEYGSKIKVQFPK